MSLCGVFACSSMHVYAPYYIDVPGTAHARKPYIVRKGSGARD